MNATGGLLIRLAVVFVVGGVFGSSDDAFYLMGSAGALAKLVAPPLFLQFLSFAVVAAALLVPARPKTRTVLFAIGVVAVVLGSHRLLVDMAGGRVRDIYLGVAVQTLSFDSDSTDQPTFTPDDLGLTVRLAQSGRGWWTLSPRSFGLDRDSLPR